jgi:hypothetical protein
VDASEGSRSRWVTVEVTRSFDNFRVGESATLEMDPLIEGWIRAGVMRIREAVHGGSDSTGPGTAREDDQRGGETGTAPEGTPGAGESPDESSGGHGSAEE